MPDESERLRLIDGFARARRIRIDDLIAALDPDPNDVIYASGSITDGLGGPESDLDIFWLTSERRFAGLADRFDPERETQQRLQGFGILYVRIGAIEFDVEVRPLATVTALTASMTALDPASAESLHRNFRYIGRWDRADALDILHRLRIGAPLHNPAGFAAVAGSFSHRHFCHWYAQLNLEFAREAQKGIRRSLDDGDPENAFLKLCHLQDLLIDAALFLAGDSLDRWKWRLAKARRTLAPDWYADYLAVRLCRAGDIPLTAFVAHWAEAGAARQAALEQALDALAAASFARRA
ncbi:hypothetical protein [Sphingomonas sp. 28-62-20]|uniref:hypothetical protein n=1 Tax=Sphingomonas sp. 28-62-20 TaxID=1970433 RepID=UPI00269AB063